MLPIYKCCNLRKCSQSSIDMPIPQKIGYDFGASVSFERGHRSRVDSAVMSVGLPIDLSVKLSL